MSEQANEYDFEKGKKALDEKMKAKYGDNYHRRKRYKEMPHIKLVDIALEKDKKINDLEMQVIKLEKVIKKLEEQLKIHDPEYGDPPDYSGFSLVSCPEIAIQL